MRRDRSLRTGCRLLAAIGAIALACCAAPVLACDDYTTDPAVPDAALRGLDDGNWIVVAEQRYQESRFTGPNAAAQRLVRAHSGGPIQLVTVRRPLMRLFAPPQRIIVQQQRPQRIVIQQAPRHAPPQRIIVQQQRPQRVIVRPPRQQAPLRIEVNPAY